MLAIFLITMGVIVSLLGFKLFRVLLPIIGLIAGSMVGFIGFQAVFGTGAISTTVAIIVAIVVGLLFALLSFFFFEIALLAYMALLGAGIMAYIGVALGLGDNGFIMFLLSLGGLVLGAIAATSAAFSEKLVVGLTSFAGVLMIFAGIFLVGGGVTVDQLQNEGIIKTVLAVIDDSFLWFFIWLGASLVAMQVQIKTLLLEVLDNNYEYRKVVKAKQ